MYYRCNYIYKPYFIGFTVYLKLSVKPLALINKLPETYKSYRVSIPQNVFIASRKREKNPQKNKKVEKNERCKR